MQEKTYGFRQKTITLLKHYKSMEDDTISQIENMNVEIVGEYVILRKEDKKSVMDSDDIMHLIQEFHENELKLDMVMKEHRELKKLMGAK